METVNMDNIYILLANYLRSPEKIKNIIKTSIYMGLKFPSGTTTGTDFWDDANCEKNLKQYMTSYCQFIGSVYDNDVLKSEYTETAALIAAADVYSVAVGNIDYIASYCFDNVFKVIFGDNEIVNLYKPNLKPFEEYMRAIALGVATLSLYISPDDTTPEADMSSLYYLLLDSPDFEDLPDSSDMYKALAACLYFVKNCKASVFCIAGNSDYLNSNFNNLTIRTDVIGYQSTIVCMYPATSNFKYIYWNETTKEWVDDPPSGWITRVGMYEYDPNSDIIQSISLSYPSNPALTPNAAISALGPNGTPITGIVAYQARTNTEKSQVITPFYTDTLDGALKPNYYREINHELYNSNNTSSYGSNTRYNFWQSGFDYASLKKIIEEDGISIIPYVIGGDFVSSGPGNLAEIDIIESFKQYYQNGGLYIIDYNNGEDVTVTLPSDVITSGIINGSINVSDVMDDNNNFLVDRDNNVIRDPGGTGTTTPQPPTSGTNDALSKYTIANGLFTVYVCDSAAIRTLGRQLYSDSVFDTLKKVFADPMQSIISLGFIPYLPTKVAPAEIVIGNYESGIQAAQLLNQYLIVDHPDIQIPDYGDDFGRYSPYAEYKLFIPFSGWQDIPAGAVIGKTVSCQSRVDCITGDMITYAFSSAGGGTEKTIIGEYSGNCLRQIPISQSSGNALLNATAVIAGGLGGGVAANPTPLGVGMAIIGTASNLATPGGIAPSVVTNGKIGANAGFMGSSRVPYIICRRKKFLDERCDYNIGRRMTLNGINGYIEVSNIKMNYPIVATKAERDEINSLLASGVYL